MAPSNFSLSMFAPFLRRSKKYRKLETDEPEKQKKKEDAHDELSRINFKIVRFYNHLNFSFWEPSVFLWDSLLRLKKVSLFQDKLLNSMSREDVELASCSADQCVTCSVNRAVRMVYPCNHVSLCRLCFVKMIKHVRIENITNSLKIRPRRSLMRFSSCKGASRSASVNS